MQKNTNFLPLGFCILENTHYKLVAHKQLSLNIYTGEKIYCLEHRRQKAPRDEVPDDSSTTSC